MRQEIILSDLSAEQIPADQRATLTVLEHPDLTEPVRLEALTSEVEQLGELAMQPVVIELQMPPSDGEEQEPQLFTLTPANFKKLSKRPINEVLAGAERIKVRRGLGRSAVNGDRIDYGTLEHAGTPHKGKISPEEAAFVRDNLDVVNERLAAADLRIINPVHPDHAKRYGFDGDTPQLTVVPDRPPEDEKEEK